jgi:hypothetical protein
MSSDKVANDNGEENGVIDFAKDGGPTLLDGEEGEPYTGKVHHDDSEAEEPTAIIINFPARRSASVMAFG